MYRYSRRMFLESEDEGCYGAFNNPFSNPINKARYIACISIGISLLVLNITAMIYSCLLRSSLEYNEAPTQGK